MKKIFLLALACGAYTSLFAQNSFPATGNVLINTSTDNGYGYQVQVNGGIRTTGSKNILGNIAFLTEGSAAQVGVGAGIICGGANAAYPLRFQGASDGYAVHGFIFEDCYGGAGKQYYYNGSFVNIHNSFTTPNQNGLSVAGLLLDGVYNNTSGMSSTIRGIYYNPTLTNVKGTHIAIETATGTNIFGSTSGNTLIGTSTDNGNKLQVSGSIYGTGQANINGLVIGKGANNLFSNVCFTTDGMPSITTGNYNTGMGDRTMSNLSTGGHNVGIGYACLQTITTGSRNTGLGSGSLNATNGNDNTCVGTFSRIFADADNSNNTTLGSQTLYGHRGNGNIAIGFKAGYSGAGWNSGSGDNNIIIGTGLDFPQLFGSNQLNLGNIIFGTGINTSTVGAGNIGIGTSSPSEKLSVNGNIKSKKVIVTQSGWADYVFEPTYKLPSLDSISSFIKANKHLPEMPSAATVEKDGQDVGEIQKLLLKKVEELTLYVIQQNEKITAQQATIQEQTTQLEQLKQAVEQSCNRKKSDE